MSPAPLVSFTKVQNSQKQNVQMNVVFDSEHFQKVIAPLEMLIVFLKICKRILNHLVFIIYFILHRRDLMAQTVCLLIKAIEFSISGSSLKVLIGDNKQGWELSQCRLAVVGSRVILFKVNKSFRIKYHCAFSYN